MNMNTSLYIKVLAAVFSFNCMNLAAQNNADYHIYDMTVGQENGMLNVEMNISPKEYKLKYNQQLEIVPVLRSLSSSDTLALPPVIVAGTNAYYNTLRDKKSEGTLLRSGKDKNYNYSVSTKWSEWMTYSRLDLVAKSTGCCGIATAPEENLQYAKIDYRPVEYCATYHYEAPKAEESKMRRIEGKAYVNFPVNRTEIYPEYMVNPVELRKITSSIDTVRMNPDATVKSITLCGFASPEGPYNNNVRLAKGRTEAVKEYVRSQYTFEKSVFHTNSVPEDWEGLRDSVAVSILPDRAQIIEFIDNGNVPVEVRNDELRKRFPVSYAYLLKNIYPSLRHTNYAIDYEIRSYTDIDEIRKVLKERPGNLSLNEFFLAANSYPVGSPEYDKVFETAAIYYPDNDIANLNAANSAMNEGDLKRAEMLLKRVKNTPSATYALGVLEAKKGNYDTAEKYFNEAKSAGVAEAEDGLKAIDKVRQGQKKVTYLTENGEK